MQKRFAGYGFYIVRSHKKYGFRNTNIGYKYDEYAAFIIYNKCTIVKGKIRNHSLRYAAVTVRGLNSYNYSFDADQVLQFTACRVL